MANLGLEFKDLSTILADMVSLATGTAISEPINTSEFVSVAQIGLKTGYDPLMTAINQVLSKTIFAVRPYNRKLRVLEADQLRYGNHVRKINYLDKPFERNKMFDLVDGESIDPWVVNKPLVVQTNVYGQVTYAKNSTIYLDQLDNAMTGPDQFAYFIAGQMQNRSDMIEQAHETTARNTVANMIGGKIHLTQYIDLLAEYATATGITLTPATVYVPDNFVPFAKWFSGYVKTLSELMTERSELFHQNFTAGTIMRHTPKDRQKALIYTGHLNTTDATALSSVFNEQYMKMVENEPINFWQSISDPTEVSVKAGVTKADGTPEEATVNHKHVLGVIFDEEAMGYTVVNERSLTSPVNNIGGYYNVTDSFQDRYWNDFTENCVVLTLGEPEA